MTGTRVSVVLPTDTWGTILPVVDDLASLSCHRDLEVVIVIPPGEAAAVRIPELERFGGYAIATPREVVPLGQARAEGVRASSSPFVFIGETHSFPCDGMLEAMLDAHARGATMVVPAFENSNPDSLASWAGFVTGYGSWTEGRDAGPLDSAPTFNVTYERAFLIDLGEKLDLAMTEGEDMIGMLARAGATVWFEPRARIGHANISGTPAWLHQRYLAGRIIAGNRSREWSLLKRGLHAVASPLVPLVLTARHRKGIVRAVRESGSVPGLLLLLTGMIAQAAGELAGYVAGPSLRTRLRYDDYEIRRLAFVRRLRERTGSTA